MGMRSDPFSSLVTIIYLLIGLVVASSHAFFTHLNTVMPVLSAVLAVLLWPLVLLGVDLHLK
jgi:Mn2+/Fe2+ NRAMP family transporter